MTQNLNDIIGKKKVLYLSKKKPELIRLILYGIVLLLSSSIFLTLLVYTGSRVVYSEIVVLAILSLILIGMVIGSYGIINEGIYQRPILVLTPYHIYLGTKNLFRSSRIYDTEVNPDRDLSLVIIRDSRTKKYQLILEGRKLLHLGYYKNLESVELQRSGMKKIFSKFYPALYISAPLYQKSD
ncbi:MAG: hypothetical protein ACFE95_07595 [Candidatus Hodarchaeota archaeon]